MSISGYIGYPTIAGIPIRVSRRGFEERYAELIPYWLSPRAWWS
jgi:hypothetical protein